MASHANLKKLQLLRDKLELKKDDIAVSEAAIKDETRELAGKQEQIGLVNDHIRAATQEMEELGKRGRQQKAERDEYLHEEVKLRTTFNTIIDQEMKVLHAERMREKELAAKAEQQETELREVSVLFEDEEAVFRITDPAYTFEELCADACRFFELHPVDVMICDEHDAQWPSNGSVRTTMMQFDNAYGRIFLKFKAAEVDEEAEDADNILQLLLKVEEQPEEEEEDEAAAAAAAAAADALASAGAAASADKKKKKEKKLNRMQLIRELPVFLLFTFLFITSLQSRRRVMDGYYQVQAIRTILIDEGFGDFNEKNFFDVANFDEVWEWIDGVLVEGLYPDGKYNGEEFAAREIGSVMTYNRIVGAIRIRQTRSRPNVACPGKDAVLNRRKVMNSTKDIFDEYFVAECHGRPSAVTEETRPFGPGIDLIDEHGSCDAIPAPPPPPSAFLDLYGVPPTTKELESMATRKLCRAFTYSPPEVTQEGYLGAEIYTYPGGGYIRDIDNPVDCRQRPETDPVPNELGVCERNSAGRDDLLLAIEQLKSNRWLDEATRAMFITITFYNANLGYFFTITFIFEFTLGGSVLPKTRQAIVNQEMYLTDDINLPTTIIEFISYAFVIYYTLVQVREAVATVRKHGSIVPYVSDVWNMLEVVVLIAFYISTYLRLTLFFSRKPDAVIFEDYFTDFFSIGTLWIETFNLDSVCLIALCFKFLKYAQLNLAMGMLWRVLVFAGKDIMYFTVMLACMLGSFAMMAVQIFGTSIYEYTLIMKSVIMLLRVLLGEFDIEAMMQASPTLGIAFFFIYIIAMFLIMMNIFLAILGEAYTVVRAETSEMIKSRVVTKKLSLLDWLKLARAVIKAKMAQRRAKREGRRARIGDLRRRGRGSSRNALLAEGGEEPQEYGGKPGGKLDAKVTIAA